MQGSGVISSFITCFYTNHLLRMIDIHNMLMPYLSLDRQIPQPRNWYTSLPTVRSQIIIHLILKIFPQISLGQLIHHSMFHDCFLFDLSKTVIRSRIDRSKISVKRNHRLPWRGITLIRGPRNTRNVKFHRSVTDDTSGYGTSLPSRSEGGRQRQVSGGTVLRACARARQPPLGSLRQKSAVFVTQTIQSLFLFYRKLQILQMLLISPIYEPIGFKFVRADRFQTLISLCLKPGFPLEMFEHRQQ